MGPEPDASTPPRPEAAPQEEATKAAAAMEAAAAASGDEAGPSPAEPAAEGAAATAEAAAPEAAEVAAPEVAEEAEEAAPGVAEVGSSVSPPAEEEEPEEWEKLEAERHRLSDWEVRLGDCINSVSARYAEERAKLVHGRELLQEELEQTRVREAAALQREKAARRRETEALEGLIAVEEMKVALADMERVAQELAAQARKASAAVEAEKAALADLAAAAAKKEEWLAARAQQTPPEEATGTSKDPREMLKARPGCKDIINTNLMDDPRLTAKKIKGFRKAYKELYDFTMDVITDSQKKSKKLREVASDHQGLAALEKRVDDERTKNLCLERANSELQRQLKEHKRALEFVDCLQQIKALGEKDEQRQKELEDLRGAAQELADLRGAVQGLVDMVDLPEEGEANLRPLLE
ncbi:uncharacterized abhydrolase domain-containing protein DDB_G0269086-like [Panicum hallii]|uniref:uncharacterized abhydrolase domain-containing protein DDB_G0269086-like n=1 Tax=Panicum hallii TaxID=206008 RepID=UPI000DF4D88F|nr:uncharacterized abhydrolase domain-containing protein DDB_G0269086-like [Panicum hallii]